MAVKADVFKLCVIMVPNSLEEEVNISKILNNITHEISILQNIMSKYKTKNNIVLKLLTFVDQEQLRV